MTKWFLNKLPTKALIKSRLKGDLKECSGVLVEPDDGVQIQVVGGLIQHQQSGLHKQGPGKQIHQLQYNTPHHCCDMGQLTFFTHTHTHTLQGTLSFSSPRRISWWAGSASRGWRTDQPGSCGLWPLPLLLRWPAALRRPRGDPVSVHVLGT